MVEIGQTALRQKGGCIHFGHIVVERAMTNIELLNGVSWHLECMVLAAGAIDNFRPPADGFQMRMHYSLYLTNLMSAIDMVCESYGNPFQTALKDGLRTSNFSGTDVLGYIRELRNGVLHRGTDPTSDGVVVDGIVCAMAPPTVQNRSGSLSYAAPAPLLRDIFVHCEVTTKPIIEHFLESGFEEIASVKPERLLTDLLITIEAAPHVPSWAKTMAREHIHIEPNVLADAQNHYIEKLRGLLKLSGGQRIA